MSLAEQPAGRPDGRAGDPSPSFRPERSSFARIASSPHPTLPINKAKGLTIHTDRVRALPAISPTLSMNIGVTAIGLGLWGALFPRHVKRTLGIRAATPVVQTIFGVRELITGFTLAGDPTKSGMLWARFAGDLFDIAVLKSLDHPRNPKQGTARAALGIVLAVTALDLITAIRMTGVQRNCEPKESGQ
jgi:hypothetical protein